LANYKNYSKKLLARTYCCDTISFRVCVCLCACVRARKMVNVGQQTTYYMHSNYLQTTVLFPQKSNAFYHSHTYTTLRSLLHFSFLQGLLVLRLPNMNTPTHEPMFYTFREKQYSQRCLAVLTTVFLVFTVYYGRRIPVA